MSQATTAMPPAEYLQAELLDTEAAARLLGLDRRSLWFWRVRRGANFPEPILLGSGIRPTPFWRRSDLQAWKESRAT